MGGVTSYLGKCDRETGYEGEGRRRVTWRQTAARKQLSGMLKDISAAARERRWKSGRGDRDGGLELDAEESEDGAGSYGSQDAWTKTGYYQVGK